MTKRYTTCSLALISGVHFTMYNNYLFSNLNRLLEECNGYLIVKIVYGPLDDGYIKLKTDVGIVNRKQMNIF